jgi:hypothetical protein
MLQSPVVGLRMTGFLKPFEIGEDDLAKLPPTQFVQLMKRLVQADLHAAGVPLSALEGTLRINISDGGEDIRVEWSDGPERTAFIPRRSTIIQCKAEKMSDAKLRAEPVLADKSGLKPAIAEVLELQGAYLLVTSKTNTTTPRRAGAAKKTVGKKSKKAKRSTVNKQIPRLAEMVSVVRGVLSKYDKRAAKADLSIYGPPKLTDWVNAHPMIAIWVKQALGYASADFAFQTMESWSEYKGLSNELIRWIDLDHNLDAIKEAIARPGKVVRLLGHSGLGKSRIAYEALLSTASQDTSDLTPIVAYARRYAPGIIGQVRDFIQNKRRVVLVVDECPPDGHRALSEEVHRSSSLLSLISLDLEFDHPPSEDMEIVVHAAPDESIRAILNSLGFAGSPEDLDRVTKFCSGFPRIAVLVSDALKEGSQHFANFRDNDHFVSMLVWGRGAENLELLRCLRCLALFESVGLVEHRRTEFEWVAQHLLKLQPNELEANLEHFYKRQILQKRGYSIAVLPRPLAAQLSAIYWKNASDAEKKTILSGQMPDELISALCNRLPDLEYVEHARDVARQLCGSSGPFGSAKALNTEIGARCLRKLAEVAPNEVLTTLVREFGNWDVHRLKNEVGPGRRYLVWTLDVLAWEPSLFRDAMRFLLRLAGAENETWSNNATGEFVQRFRVQLPGTSASLEQRLRYLTDYVDEAEEPEVLVIISTLHEAIDARGHSRTIGSEQQGTRKSYVDFRPKIWKEVFDYVRGCLNLLLKIGERDARYLQPVRRALESIDMGYVIAETVFPVYSEVVRRVRPTDMTWGVLLDTLSWTIKNRLGGEDVKDVRAAVEALFSELLPKTISDRILFFIKNVPWHFRELNEEGRHDHSRNKRRAAELGRQCADDLTIFREVVGPLTRGEVREGFAFGESLYDASASKSEVLEVALEALASARLESPNPSLVGGMLFALGRENVELYQSLLSQIVNREGLAMHTTYLASLHLSSEGVALIVHGLERGDFAPQATYILGAGRVMEPLPATSVSALISSLRAKGAEGAFASLDLLGMYCHESHDKFFSMREEIDATLRSEAFYQKETPRAMVDFHYEELASKLLDDGEYGAPFAQFIANRCIELTEHSKLRNDSLLQKLAGLIFAKYPQQSLERFAAYVEQSGAKERWVLSYILGSPFSFDDKQEGPLFSLDKEVVIEACRKYPRRFAVLVAEIAPLFVTGEGRSWSPLGLALFDEFGARKDILSAITSNIYTGGWSGSHSEHLRSYLGPLRIASDHKRSQVRAWARQQLDSLNRQIAKAVRDEEEEGFR